MSLHFLLSFPSSHTSRVTVTLNTMLTLIASLRLISIEVFLGSQHLVLFGEIALARFAKVSNDQRDQCEKQGLDDID